MVMHARKIPRVNDGMYERNQARPYENTEKYPSKGSNYNDRYNSDVSRESPMYNRQQDDSPGSRGPRYINKTSYIERTKDKFERMPSRSPADKKLNHLSSIGGYQGDHVDGDRHSNHDRSDKNDRNHGTDKPVQQNSSCDWSEHISSSGKKYYYNSRTEVSQWERPPEFVEKIPVIETRQKDKDFRGQINKHTLYSNREQEDRKHSSGRDSRFDGAKTSSFSTNRYTDKHTANQQAYDRFKFTQNKYPSTSCVDSTGVLSATTSMDSYQKTKMSQPQRSWQGLDMAQRDGYMYGRQDNMPAVSRSFSESSDHRTWRTGSHSLQAGVNTSVGFSQNGARLVGSSRSENEDSHLMDDMDISPGSTPTHSPRPARPVSHTSIGGQIVSSGASVNSYSSSLNSGAMTGSSHISASSSTPKSASMTPTDVAKTLPQLISQLGDKTLQRIDSQELTQQAIQTLQQLQHLTSALTRQAQNAAAGQSPRSDMTSPFPQQSPQVNSHVVTSASSLPPASVATVSHHHHHHHTAGREQTTPTSTPNQHTLQQQQQHPQHSTQTSHKDDKYDGRDSPNSEVSHRSSGRGSPTPSQSSSQGLPVSAHSGGSLSAPPAATKPPAVQISPSLANHYEEKSTAHVLGWPGIHAERQANRYSEEAHTVGSLHCTQVSADLKKARSLVRVAEIQATLQEQRVLFLRQQIKELENLKSQNTFMPTQDKGL